MTSEINNRVEGLNSKITQTRSLLTSEVNNRVEGLNSEITQTGSSLTYKAYYSKKQMPTYSKGEQK